MGALVEQAAEVVPPPRGEGQLLVDWWDQADDDDRALFRQWCDRGVSQRELSERLTEAGWPICKQTLAAGIRRLRSTEWAT